MSPMEVESTLVICSRDPERVADEIADLRLVGVLSCRARAQLSIVDSYVDLPRNDLRRVGVGLRVRSVGNERFLTFKGPALERANVKAREEVEKGWSRRALEAVCSKIREHGVPIPTVPAHSNRAPLDVLAEMGFLVIQERTLSRRPRELTQPPRDEVLAELDIDAVRYTFGDRSILHHEVEIEVKSERGEDAMRLAVRHLDDLYTDAVRPWRFGKLATGNAVQALLDRGELDHVIDRFGRLQPEAYDLLDAWFTGGSPV